MKKVLLIAALSMVAAPAFASKARLSALGGSAHLTDTQKSFEQPWQVAGNGELATVEFGGNAGKPDAEGGFVRQMGEGYLGLYLGHQPTAMTTLLGNFTVQDNAGTPVTSTTKEAWALNNPFNIWYGAKNGDMTWGVNFFYLSSNVKTGHKIGATTTKERKANAMGVSLGATNGVWDAALVLGLSGKASFIADANTRVATSAGTATPGANNEVTFTSKSNVKLIGGYTSDTLYYYGSYGMSGGKMEVAGTEQADLQGTDLQVGVINSHKKDGTDFFYGISYKMTTTENKTGAGDKVETTSLPLIVGVEAEANSWLVLRGSLTQNFPLLGSTKATVAGVSGDSDTLADSTAVNFGTGMKFGKFTVDTLVSAAKTGDIGVDAPNFLTNASLTYAF